MSTDETGSKPVETVKKTVDITTDARKKLDAAWHDLTKDGQSDPSVRAMQKASSVANNVVAEYIRQRRTRAKSAELPYEELLLEIEPSLRAFFETMWSAVRESVTEQAQSNAREQIEVAVAAEVVAAAEAEKLSAERDAATKKVEELTAEVSRIPDLESRIAELELELIRKNAIIDFFAANRKDTAELREILATLTATSQADEVESQADEVEETPSE